jgi:hypothetical protein
MRKSHTCHCGAAFPKATSLAAHKRWHTRRNRERHEEAGLALIHPPRTSAELAGAQRIVKVIRKVQEDINTPPIGEIDLRSGLISLRENPLIPPKPTLKYCPGCGQNLQDVTICDGRKPKHCPECGAYLLPLAQAMREAAGGVA